MADKFPQSEPNFIQSHQVVLEAGRVSILECYGRTFVCVSAAAGFAMSFNNGKYFDCRNGVEWSMNPDERYNLLKFRSAIAQTLSILTGNFFYHENVVTPVASVAQTFIKTAYDPVLVNPIAAGASYSVSGTGASGSGLGYRKHFILTNLDADLDLDVLDSADSLRGTVFARQANVFETSDTLKIKNNSGQPIEFRLMEIFYAA
jgi:hypothetical protein